MDVRPATTERESSELPRLRALLAQIVGGPAATVDATAPALNGPAQEPAEVPAQGS